MKRDVRSTTVARAGAAVGVNGDVDGLDEKDDVRGGSTLVKGRGMRHTAIMMKVSGEWLVRMWLWLFRECLEY